MPDPVFRSMPLDGMTRIRLEELSRSMDLALDACDMCAIQDHFKSGTRAPTDVELEVIAQTWSEHCKHRTFNAVVEHGAEILDGLFKTFIRDVSTRISAGKGDFVLGAFEDNAGFIRLDEKFALCFKVETHNHPSAIEPYAGANTGLGGVIRDILGAGKGAKPVANLDVFCFGRPELSDDSVPENVIHPRDTMKGVVRGVADYGNRMGIPTVSGAVYFHEKFTHNPLVFCGTAGVIPVEDISKRVEPGMILVLAGGHTGRDGLHGATFSSLTLDEESHDTDRGAVQIGNPIEEKKLTDFILQSRIKGLIESINDCGAGGISSAAGEILSRTGGTLILDDVHLKETGLKTWEILLSESQERMILVIRLENLEPLRELAAVYETTCSVIGKVEDNGILQVVHGGETVCSLENSFLHHPPVKRLQSECRRPDSAAPTGSRKLKTLLADINICSREPVIRQYDHEVQGNTLIKPLAGAGGDCPQDGAVMQVRGSSKYFALGVSLTVHTGGDPFAMGHAAVDEAVRQVLVTGANPDKIALLDNFCAGDPRNTRDLGPLVECLKGLSSAAGIFQAPFISGKDSFNNTYQSPEGTESIPLTLLTSSIGIIDDSRHITGASIRRNDSLICLLGAEYNPQQAVMNYRAFYEAVQAGCILSAHDISDGGLAVALAEAAFSMKAGVEADTVQDIYAECPGRIIFEINAADREQVEEVFRNSQLSILGHTTAAHRRLVIRQRGQEVVNEPLEELKAIWQNALKPWC